MSVRDIVDPEVGPWLESIRLLAVFERKFLKVEGGGSKSLARLARTFRRGEGVESASEIIY